MIYYSNVAVDVPHMVFIGRWTPFHQGHKTIIESKREEYPGLPILIQVRSTSFDDYSPQARAEFIKMWMVENKIAGTIMIVPDIQGVYWGRGVGYKLEQVQVSKEVEEVSATKIRKGIKDKDMDWKIKVASKEIANLLNPKTAQIIDQGLVVWLTGCPCAGKTTLAQAFEKKVRGTFPQLKIQLLDGDVIRDSPMARGVGFSPKDREGHILRMGQLAKMFADHGILVIAAFVSPDRKVRAKIKRMIGKDRFVEVYVKATQEERIRRDTKGMYKKAIKGKIKNFTGYSAPYEEPKREAVVCDTDKENASESVKKMFERVFVD